MQIQPKDVYEKLEFDKILDLLARECLGAAGRELIQNLKPEVVLSIIKHNLLQVNELKKSIEQNEPFPIAAYPAIAADLKILQIEGSVLTVESLQRISRLFRLLAAILHYFEEERKESYPSLYAPFQNLEYDPSLIQAMDQVIDEEGQIRPDASPELLKVSRAIAVRQNELDKQFRLLINGFRKKGWLTDNVESFRNGRRVLSVPSEHKRKIRGIIHDESTTGKTAFIEPETIIDINNDIFDLETEKRREIYRLLKSLSDQLRPLSGLLKAYSDLLAQFDSIQARARLAIRLDAHLPKLKAEKVIDIRNGYHPLLLLKNQERGTATIPFTLQLHPKSRILMLSGPNAGGKSILMKSVGLLQLMLQAGMLVPLSPDSEMSIFSKVFADIGDQQSLEDDLSTYSSRLRNMRLFLQQADASTLLLIDEFGSGTDPKIGGAIAEAILKKLNARKLFGVITTHYSNLKVFAFKTHGIINGAMTFNNENLSPTYQLKVGRPGSSFAYEIAEKSGLDKKVLSYAKFKTGASEKAVDELLIDLQRDKKALDEQLQRLTEREKKLDRLIKSYDRMNQELEVKRKKLKLESKEQNLQGTARQNRELTKLIRELREEKKLEEAKELASKLREEKKQLAEDVGQLREDVYQSLEKKGASNKPIEVGDFVRLRSGGATGKVESISKSKAIVLMGTMKMTAALRDLQQANEPLDVRSSKAVQTDTSVSSATFESKVDLRGLRKEEALKILENFVDKALMNNATHLNILHGKGNGVLRQAVRQKLREYSAIKKIWHPEQQQGGDGVTLVSL